MKHLQNLFFDLTPEDRAEVEQNISRDIYGNYRFVAWTVAAMQLTMIVIFLFKKGGPFTSVRRASYFGLYCLLLTATLLFLWMASRLVQNRPKLLLQAGAVYSLLICLWSCAITALDQIGGNGIIVYCYMLPTVAAFGFFQPKQSAAIFGSSCLLLNLVLPFFPGGIHNLFSNLMNSVFISFMAFFISVQLSQSKVRAYYDKITIRRQNDALRRTNRMLEQQVLTDPLTQLHNRRYLNEVVPKIWGQVEENRTVAGLMLDIDFFKQYNDHYGHFAGDDCLQTIALLLQEAIQGLDASAVRYGGEEFFLLLLGQEPGAVLDFAEKLRVTVTEKAPAREDLGGSPTTISVGICISSRGETPELNTIIERADRALYQAKTRGRNCTVLYTDPS